MKSHILFFNAPNITQRNIVRILVFSIATLPTKYLGDPLTDTTIKHSSWFELLDKLERKLSSCTFRSLNIVGWIVLIKSVLQALPLYIFLLLVAPKWVLKSIRNLGHTFLWGGNKNHSKWYLSNENCLQA